MTPEEIVERVKRCRGFDPDVLAGMFKFSDIDHLLAIHAAVVEMLNARHEANTTRDIEVLIRASDRQLEATNNLAALCGWKAEESTR